MVYYIMGTGGTGFQIMSEDNRTIISIDSFEISINVKTVLVGYPEGNQTKFMGKIRFETNNDMIIKDNVLYIN